VHDVCAYTHTRIHACINVLQVNKRAVKVYFEMEAKKTEEKIAMVKKFKGWELDGSGAEFFDKVKFFLFVNWECEVIKVCQATAAKKMSNDFFELCSDKGGPAFFCADKFGCVCLAGLVSETDVDGNKYLDGKKRMYLVPVKATGSWPSS
jgi:hypothetical protein